jgi:hypothetical protein
MNTIKARESIIIKQLCIYQIPRIQKVFHSYIIMEFLFYDKVNGAAKILHKSYITRYLSTDILVERKTYIIDYYVEIIDICNTRVKYCSNICFQNEI